MKKTKTNRGFGRIDFVDRYGNSCSLQESSLASDSAIWFGVDDAKPQILIEGKGWIPYEIPDEVLLHTRMHLTQKQVKELLPHLQKFVETGTL